MVFCEVLDEPWRFIVRVCSERLKTLQQHPSKATPAGQDVNKMRAQLETEITRITRKNFEERGVRTQSAVKTTDQNLGAYVRRKRVYTELTHHASTLLLRNLRVMLKRLIFF